MIKFKTAEIENPQRKYGGHQYSLKDFGLEEKDIENQIEEYREFLNNTELFV